MANARFASDPACDGKKLFIEVTGLSHATTQDFALYDPTDMQQQFALEKKKKTEAELKDTTIYSWDWRAESENRNVGLRVQSSKGPINLPLFNDVADTKRQKTEQKYLLHAFIPLTVLPTFNAKIKKEQRTAPVRNGYVYIAYHNKLWREIEVTATDAGEPCFKDVDLFAYREGRDQPFQTKTRREVTGEALKEIFYPAKDNGSRTDIRFAFSEVQWSGSRLNYLEEHPDELKRRMEKAPSHPALLDDLPEMRAREPALEMLLGEPQLLNQDITGAWLAGEYQHLKSEIRAAMHDGATAVSQYNNEMANKQDPHRYDFMLRQTARSELLGEAAQSPAKPPEWDKIAGVSDSLAEGKSRHLRGVVFDDPIFELRHLSYLVKAGIGEMSVLLRDAATQPYFKPAELVQRFFVPKKWGNTDNPYHDYMNTASFDGSPEGRFRRTTRLTERMLCFVRVGELQQVLSRALDSKALAIVLKDITSMDDVNAAGVYPLVGNAVSSLSLQIGSVDTLGLGEPGHDRKNPYISQLQTLLSNDRSHPLHALLFTENGQIPLDGEYTPPAAENDGSGLCTPAGVARWADDHLLIKPAQLEVFELGGLFPDDAEENGEGPFPALRRIATAVDGMMQGYFIALNEIMGAVSQSSTMALQFETVYVPLLSTLKASGPTAFGKLELADIDNVKQNYLVIGVEGAGLTAGLSDADRQFLTKQTGRNPFKRVYDVDGKLVLTTNKRTAVASMNTLAPQSAEKLAAKGAFKLVVVPEGDPIGEIYSKPATKRTLADMVKSQRLAEVYERLRVPHIMVGIELWNLLSANKQNIENLSTGKNVAYSFANVMSAGMDLTIALAHSANMALGMESSFAKAAETPFYKFSSGSMKNLLTKVGLKTVYSRLLTFSSIAGFLTAGLAILDAIQLWQDNDDAAAAMMAVGIGTAMATLASMAVDGSFLSALGPWGIAIAIFGGILYMYLKDTPFEIWLKNGPFGTSPGEKYAHLQDPDTASQRLLGLLLRFDVKMYELNKQTRMNSQTLAEWQAAGVTHLLWIKSNLSQLINQNKEKSRLFVRQALMEHKSRLVNTASRTEFVRTQTLTELEKFNDTPVKKIETADGDLYGYQFRKTVPADRTETGWLYSKRELYHYEPGFLTRAQFVINDMMFPQAALDEPSPLGDPTALPSFTEDGDKRWIHDQLPRVKPDADKKTQEKPA